MSTSGKGKRNQSKSFGNDEQHFELHSPIRVQRRGSLLPPTHSPKSKNSPSPTINKMKESFSDSSSITREECMSNGDSLLPEYSPTRRVRFSVPDITPHLLDFHKTCSDSRQKSPVPESEFNYNYLSRESAKRYPLSARLSSSPSVKSDHLAAPCSDEFKAAMRSILPREDDT